MSSCENSPSEEPGYRTLPPEFYELWADEQAEVNIYALEQASDGELHEGRAIMTFDDPYMSDSELVEVTEPDHDDRQVLKMNLIREFTTGVYPNTIMTSAFNPLHFPEEHAYKLTASVQDWRNHSYAQVTHDDVLISTIKSFANHKDEGDQRVELSAGWLEDELWNTIRLNPENLPTGEVVILPALHYLMIRHVAIDTYLAEASNKDLENGMSVYKLKYSHMDRELKIRYRTEFPHVIESWEEAVYSGWGDAQRKLTTMATRISTSRSKFWELSSTGDSLWKRNFEVAPIPDSSWDSTSK